MPDDYSADRFTPGRIAGGGSVTGMIDTIVTVNHKGTSETDGFAVALVAETNYRIQLLTQNGFGTVFDTYLAGVYYDFDGILIRVTAEKNQGTGKHAPLTFNPTETGTYYIAAADANWRGVGAYTVEGEEAM